VLGGRGLGRFVIYTHSLSYRIVLWAHSSLVSNHLQCSLTSSLGEFSGYLDFLWFLGVPPVLVSIAFSWCFSINSSSPAIGFHSRFFLTTNVSAPIRSPFTHSLFRRVFRLLYQELCGGTEVRMEHKSRSKFLFSPGLEPWTLVP